MIYIVHGTVAFKDAPRQYIRDIDGFFDDYSDTAWMECDLAKRVISKIDKSDLVAPRVVESPIFGQIPYTWISGGAKILIMMNSVQDVLYDGDNLGDDC